MQLGCEDGVYADSGGFIGSDGQTVDWLGADQNLSEQGEGLTPGGRHALRGCGTNDIPADSP
jgi:hypothetical protein